MTKDEVNILYVHDTASVSELNIELQGLDMISLSTSMLVFFFCDLRFLDYFLKRINDILERVRQYKTASTIWQPC